MKLQRITGKVFGETASATGDETYGPYIGQFGSAKIGTYNGTTDVATIQSLAAWSNGFIDAVTPSNQYPPLPEMTGALKVLSHQGCYLLQQGIAEWDDATTYYLNAFCAYNGIIYQSIEDENINNNPATSDGYWKVYGALDDYANQSLSNLNSFGNARLQYAPFSINSGETENGENATLHVPAGSSTTIEAQWTQPKLTSNSSDPEITISANSGSANAYKIFNGITGNDGWAPQLTGSFSNRSFYIEMRSIGKALNIKKLTIYNRNPGDGYNQGMTSGSVQVSADGDTWINVKDWTNGNVTRGSNWSIDLNYVGYYEYLRFYVYSGYSAHPSNYVAIAEMKVNATYLVSVGNSTTIVQEPCIFTTADGRTAISTEASVYDVTNTPDGDYCIFKDYEDGALSLIEKSKFAISKTAPLGVTVTGTLTNSSGVLSGFSTSNYATLPNNFDVSNGETWEMVFNVSTGNDATTNQYFIGSNIAGSYDPVIIGIYNNNFAAYINFSSSGPSTAITTSVAPQADSEYTIKLEFTGSEYNLYINDVLSGTVTSSSNLWTSNIILGVQAYGSSTLSSPWLGSIDLNNSYIKIDDKIWWSGLVQNWLDTSIIPASLKVWDDEQEQQVINNDLVYIGDCSVLSGVVSDISNREFNDSGYIVDRYANAVVIESYASGSSWYNVYSNGWCEQGGRVTSTGAQTVMLLKTYKNTNYTIQTSTVMTSATNSYASSVLSTDKTGNSWKAFCYASSGYNGFYWQTSGYIAV